MSHRLYFTVTSKGFCTDGSFHLGRPIQFSLPQHLHKLDVGDQVSIPIEDCPRGASIDSRDIFIESGRYFGESERKEFQTKGPEPLGSWTPIEALPNPVLSDPDKLRIANLAEFVVRARTHVSRDGRTREMDYVPDAEASPRLSQQLAQLARGSAVLQSRAEVIAHDMGLVRRVAFDCLPPARAAVIEYLNSTTSSASNASVVAATHLNKSMVSRQLEELHGLGLVERTITDTFSEGECSMSDEARELLRVGLGT